MKTTIDHHVSPRHPDHGLSLDHLVRKAEARGDLSLEMTHHTVHREALQDQLDRYQTIILRSPTPLMGSQDRWVILWAAPWELDQFQGWLDAQETMNRIMGFA